MYKNLENCFKISNLVLDDVIDSGFASSIPCLNDNENSKVLVDLTHDRKLLGDFPIVKGLQNANLGSIWLHLVQVGASRVNSHIFTKALALMDSTFLYPNHKHMQKCQEGTKV